ncbi:MAG TPA: monofunctional biosynthetic peptidoglycan transglycosylase [Bacteroidota bacterium]
MAPGSELHPSIPRRITGWMRKHKVSTALLLFLVFLLAELASIPWFAVARMKTENPAGTALMRQREAEAEAAGKPFRVTQKWISLSHIPKQVVDAVVVAEDGTFFTHGGVDWFEVRESLEKDIQEGRAARGASTITQQLAKNLFLSTSKDPVRKVKELVITFLMEQELDKDRILEIYLNIVEWGPGVFGVEAASETYFGVHAENLTLDQAARLAAVIPSPLRHRPDSDGRYVLRRKEIVLGRMGARNMIPAPPGILLGEPGVAARDSAGVPPGVPGETAGEDTMEIDEGRENGL